MEATIKTIDNKGIYLTRNGITFSIQFGAGNYCDNYDKDIAKQFRDKPDTKSSDCEIAVIESGDNWITYKAFPEEGEHIEGSNEVVGNVPICKALERFLSFTSESE